jgi:hypothetical protein
MASMNIHHVEEIDTETYQQEGTGSWVKKIMIKTEEGVFELTLFSDDKNNLKD